MPRRLLLGLSAFILCACMAPSSGSAVSAATRAGAGPAGSLPKVSAGSPGRSLIHLPRDQAAHSSAHNEWWYVVGHVHSGTRTFGYETTIFKFVDVRPPGFSTALTLYRADVAITDESKHAFHQSVTYYFPNDASISSSRLNEKVGDASLSGSAPSNMRLISRLTGGSIDLRLSSRRPEMDVGGNGYIPFGDAYTYYYSLTDLATSGILRVKRQTFHVTGISWMDHQWGNWSWQAIKGWTWMALQLDNGTQLSVFDFRGTKRVKAASVLPKGSGVRTLYNISIGSRGTWLSPHTHGRYPSGWTVRIPGERAVLTVTPAVRDQELISPVETRASYWEGSGRVTGTWLGSRVTGLSYTELTGYAK